jgi:hypothetical protein
MTNRILWGVVCKRLNKLKNIEGVVSMQKRLKTGNQNMKTQETMKWTMALVMKRIPWYIELLCLLCLC